MGENERRRNDLRNDGAERNARNVHLAHDDEKDVQPHVGNARRTEKKEGVLRIAPRAAQRGAEVVQKIEGHPGEIDLQIQGREGQNAVLRHIHQEQEVSRHQHAENG